MIPVGLHHPHPQAEHGEDLPQPGELRAGAVVHQYGSSVFHAATSLHLGQGLLDVGNQVGGVLDSAGETDQMELSQGKGEPGERKEPLPEVMLVFCGLPKALPQV